MFNLPSRIPIRRTHGSERSPKRRILGTVMILPVVVSVVGSFGWTGIGIGSAERSALLPVLFGVTDAVAQAPGAVDVTDSLYGTSSSTIRDLLRNSRRQIANNQFEPAGITLERALAIQSDNPVLWNALARLRYRQGGYREVQSLTMRSESLAGSNRNLILRNRQLAAAATQAMTGVVTAIADLDLQTPNEAVLAAPSVTGNTGSRLNLAGSGLNPPRTLSYESLPAPAPAQGSSSQGSRFIFSESIDATYSQLSDIDRVWRKSVWFSNFATAA